MQNKNRESGQKACFAAEIIVHGAATRQAETTHGSDGEEERERDGAREGERTGAKKTEAEKALLFLSKVCYTAVNENQNCKRVYEQKEILVF